jgi:hypothetical protein
VWSNEATARPSLSMYNVTSGTKEEEGLAVSFIAMHYDS